MAGSSPDSSDTEGYPTAERLPRALVETDQWLCWREKDRDGKTTKVPIDPATGTYASATDPSTWGSFEAAREYAIADNLAGVGFVFTESDPFVGVDLDDCRVTETETQLDWATEIIDTLDSYTEISPSGTGFHILVEGTLPGDRSRKGNVEMYETARFFTVTGTHVDGTPEGIQTRTDELARVYEEYVAPQELEREDNTRTESSPSMDTGKGASSSGDTTQRAPVVDLSDDALLSKARSAANGDKFERLWSGDTRGYESNSEADMALCALLVFWTGSDTQRMDRLFRKSGLMREKWDEVHFSDGSTYGEKTVERASMAVSDHYEPENASRKGREQTRSEAGAITVPSAGSSEIGASDELSCERKKMEGSTPRALLETIQTLESEIESLRAENESLRSELEEARTARKAAEDSDSRQKGESTRDGFWSRFRR